MPKDVIVACDFPTAEETLRFLDRFDGRRPFVKIGMELFYAAGPEIVKELRRRQHRIFLDLKLHDIPNTVAGGLCSLMGLGADILNIHASGGYTMMKKSAEALRAAAEKQGIACPKLIAVTVLTSINAEEWAEMGHTGDIGEQVIRLAELAKKAGLDGVVASPQEAAAIRKACGEDFLIVTPGIRPAGSSLDDQSRISTPSAALRNGATHLVVGRPVRSAEDPRAAAEKIVKEMGEA